MKSKSNRVSHEWRLKALVIAIAAVFNAGNALGNGTGPVVVGGQASFSNQGKSLNITNSPGTIINWQGFSIGAGETTRFIQQSAVSSVLNRVIGPDPSVILGALLSNGRVFLINPGGILVGHGARIDVAGLVASTLNLSNQDFLAGRLNFTATPFAGNVENLGTITTPTGGSVYLVGANVTNSGIINSAQGSVILAAGQSVKIIDSGTPGVRVEITAGDNTTVNLGEILARSGQVGIYGAALRNAGIIDANEVVRDASGKIVLRAKRDITLEAGSRLSANGAQGGEITVQSESGTTLVSGMVDAKGTGAVAGTGGTVHLLGNRVELVAANIDVSGPAGGGTVLVGGNFHGTGPEQNSQHTSLDGGVNINANAINTGNAGRIAVWSDGETTISGTLTARGGANSGDGGFIETSGKQVLLADTARIDTLAPHGNTGHWLLDPVNWTISATGDETPGSVVTSLASSNRTILADNDITVGDAVTWTTAQTLTLNAGHDVLVNAAMTASTAGSGIVLIAGNDVTTTAAITASSLGSVIDMSAGRNVSAVTITADGGGSVNLRANNDVIVNGVISADTGLDSVILRADNDGSGPGAIGGTVKFVGTGAVITPRTIIRFNPDGYANTSSEIADYSAKVSAILDAKAWVFAQGDNKIYTGNNAATLSFKGTPAAGGDVNLIDPGSGATFSDQNAVVGKTVTYAGFSINGVNSGRFALFGDGSGTTTANITPAALTAVGLVGAVTKTYDGDATVTNLTSGNYSISGFVAGEGATIGVATGTYDNGKDVVNNPAGSALTSANLAAGDYTQNAGTLLSNYDLSAVTGVSAQGNIGSITRLDTTVSGSRVYDQSVTAAGGDLSTVTALIAGDLVSVAGTGSVANKNVEANKVVTNGSLALASTDAGNYNLLAAGNTLSITRLDTTVSGSRVYDQSVTAAGGDLSTVTALIAGDLVSVAGTGSVANKNVEANKVVTNGSLALASTDAGNYNLLAAGNTLSITRLGITGSITAADKVYDSTTAATIVNRTLVGALPGDTVNYSGGSALFSNKDVANNILVTGSGLALSGADAGNYSVITSATTTADITPAPLSITANSATRVYGNANPAFSATYSGLQGGENPTALAGALVLATPAIPASNVGNYAIIPSGQSSSNYTISYVDGNLGITPGSLIVVADAKSKLFGTIDPAFTFSVAGLANNPALGTADTAGSVLSGTLVRVPGESALGGPYAITQGSLATGSNYILAYTGNSLIITGAAAEPVPGFNAGQVIFTGATNSEFYYRPGNFWHISLNPNNADPVFDVMRGTSDLRLRLDQCDSIGGGGFCQTWSFPQQFGNPGEK